MDKKSIIVIAIITLLIIGWFPLVNKLWPPKPIPAQTNTVVSATNKLTNVTANAQTSATAAAASPKDADALPHPEPLLQQLDGAIDGVLLPGRKHAPVVPDDDQVFLLRRDPDAVVEGNKIDEADELVVPVRPPEQDFEDQVDLGGREY